MARHSPHTLRASLLCLGLLTACGDATDTASVEEGEWLPGGDTTNTLLLGSNAFTAPSTGLPPAERRKFFTGNGFFNENWVTAPASTASRDGLGPTFNARSCSGCHFKDGRGRPPEEGDDAALGLLFRISVPGEDAHGGPLGEPNYGGQLQPFGVMGVPAEVRVTLTYEELPGEYPDGDSYSLREPRYDFDALAFGPLAKDVRISPRVAQAVIGMGLLEAIPEQDLLAAEDPDDADDDGISGRANWVWDISAQSERLGRFGWKAGQPSVLQQTAGALNGDIGITSRLFPEEDCPAPQLECQDAERGGAPEISDHLLDALTVYSQTLAPPVRKDWDDPEVLRGKYLFGTTGCADCHTPKHVTGEHEIEVLSGQTIWPYTDMLLHDMGEALADGRPVYLAGAREWRTSPLWGIGRLKDVNGHERLLHDGRARGIEEAILWHGGEGETAREAFESLPRVDREALLRFVRSL